jgi:hypothetical protein
VRSDAVFPSITFRLSYSPTKTSSLIRRLDDFQSSVGGGEDEIHFFHLRETNTNFLKVQAVVNHLHNYPTKEKMFM